MKSQSMLASYRETQRLHEELTARLQQLEQDAEVKRDLEFERKLKELMAEYGYSLGDVISIIDPVSTPKTIAKKIVRQSKTYRNPNTGELVEASSLNNKVLQAWKKQYGIDAVKSWVQAV